MLHMYTSTWTKRRNILRTDESALRWTSGIITHDQFIVVVAINMRRTLDGKV